MTTSLVASVADAVGDALGEASFEVGDVMSLPTMSHGDSTNSSFDKATHTLVIRLSHLKRLTSAAYRVGDLTMSLVRAISGGSEQLYPYVRIKLIGSDVAVRTRTLRATAQGDACINETLLIPLPLDSLTQQPTIQISVHNQSKAVGAMQSSIVGDPLIGSVTLRLQSAHLQDEALLTIMRDGKPRGQMKISQLSFETRPDRELVLLKAALLTSVVGTHWGLAIHHGIYEMVAAGNANGGPTALLGPHGLIASTVAAKDWSRWKLALNAQRARQGFLGPEALRYEQKGEPIPDDKLRQLMPSRPHRGFDAKQALLPNRTLRTDDEIEAFSIDWVRRNPVYDTIDANCQRYIKDLYLFLTCGHTCGYTDLQEAFNVLFDVAIPVGIAGTATALTVLTGPIGLIAAGSAFAAGAVGGSLASSGDDEKRLEEEIRAAVQDSLQVSEEEDLSRALQESLQVSEEDQMSMAMHMSLRSSAPDTQPQEARDMVRSSPILYDMGNGWVNVDSALIEANIGHLELNTVPAVFQEID